MTLTDHEITVEQVKLVIREGEGLTVEFKERYTPRIDEDIVAFTNAKGGTLLLGVRDEADEARVKNAGILFFAKDVYDHLHQAQMTLLAFKGKGKAGELH